jgi:hypothetical protein
LTEKESAKWELFGINPTTNHNEKNPKPPQFHDPTNATPPKQLTFTNYERKAQRNQFRNLGVSSLTTTDLSLIGELDKEATDVERGLVGD